MVVFGIVIVERNAVADVTISVPFFFFFQMQVEDFADPTGKVSIVREETAAVAR